MAQTRNIYAGNDINRSECSEWFIIMAHIALSAVKMHSGRNKKIKQQIFPVLCRCHSLFCWKIYERLINSAPKIRHDV